MGAGRGAGGAAGRCPLALAGPRELPTCPPSREPPEPPGHGGTLGARPFLVAQASRVGPAEPGLARPRARGGQTAGGGGGGGGGRGGDRCPLGHPRAATTPGRGCPGRSGAPRGAGGTPGLGPLTGVCVPAGSPRSKIRMWLQDCGAAALEEPGLRGHCACGSSGTSFEDDLSLGAEALLLPESHKSAGRDRLLSPGHSMASSVPSSVHSSVPSSLATTSSLAEVLAWWQSDAEEILHNLGFVGTEPGVASRVPSRFFSSPSRASGIDLGLFLRAQLRRLEMEDPCLLLASRFQQVQALAVTADAFFCLYSYVSRTPLQRIAPPRHCRDMPDSPELRGARPGERLKRAVSSLCLYTGGDGDIPRGSQGVTLGPPSSAGTGGRWKDPGGAAEGWRRDGDTGTAQRGQTPAGTPAGTAWGHPQRCCPHGKGVWGHGGAPCPAGAAQQDTSDPQPDTSVTVSPTLHASRVGVTLGAEGDSGLACWCHPCATARAGGHRAWLRGCHPGLQPPGSVPSPLGAAESFELEEVLSEEDDEDDDDNDDDDEDDEDAPEEAFQSPRPSTSTRRSSMLHRRSDSSGFGEELLPASAPPDPTG